MNRITEGSVLPGRAAAVPCPCRWLVALDYDGTLRSREGKAVTDSFYALMRHWRPFGVRWGINTGRSLPYLCSELLPDAPFLPDFICTTERYTYVSDAEGVLRPAVEFNRISCEANILLRSRIASLLSIEMSRLQLKHPDLVWQFDPNDSLSIQAEDEETMNRIAFILQPFADSLEGVSMQRAGRYMRLSDARYHKGTALRYVLESWGVSPERLFIMGDGHNDLDAFRHFPESYYACPADAHSDVRQWVLAHGGHVSTSAGVEEMLHRWFCERVLAEVEQEDFASA